MNILIFIILIIIIGVGSSDKDVQGCAMAVVITLFIILFILLVSNSAPNTPSGKSTGEVLYPKDHNFTNELLKKANELR